MNSALMNDSESDGGSFKGEDDLGFASSEYGPTDMAQNTEERHVETGNTIRGMNSALMNDNESDGDSFEGKDTPYRPTDMMQNGEEMSFEKGGDTIRGMNFALMNDVESDGDFIGGEDKRSRVGADYAIGGEHGPLNGMENNAPIVQKRESESLDFAGLRPDASTFDQDADL